MNKIAAKRTFGKRGLAKYKPSKQNKSNDCPEASKYKQNDIDQLIIINA